MISKPTYQVGTFLKIHGIKGELVMQIIAGVTLDLENEELVFLEIEGQLIPFFIEQIRIISEDTAIIKLDFIATPEEAAEYTGTKVFIASKSEIKPDQPDYGIEGYTVEDIHAGTLGIVKHIIEYPDNPVMQIMNRKKEILIPYHSDLIHKMDHKKRLIILNVPSGLLDIYD